MTDSNTVASQTMPSHVDIYDTTLRDGAQSEDISFSVQDKLRVVRYLDDLGVHYIEGGWPSSNPKEMEFFHQVQEMDLKQAQVSAFGSTHKASVAVEDDKNLQGLLACGADVLTIFGKSWDFHVTTALGISLARNL